MAKDRTTIDDHEVVIDMVNIEKQSGAPRYQQLYEQLRALIRQGTLQPGMCLPSSRALSRDLGIARNTVITAYGQLETEGYIETSPGSLARVTNLPSLETSTSKTRLIKLVDHISVRGHSLVDQNHAPGNPPINFFQPGMPDMREFPLPLWRRFVNDQLKYNSEDVFGYHSFRGFQPLREEIASYVETARAVRCSPEQILVTNGAQSAMILVAHLFTDPGDDILFEEPGYTGAQGAFLAAGTKLRPLHVRDGEWQINKLGKIRPKLIYLTPSCQFPLGYTMRMEQRLKLIKYSINRGAWILEDDFDSEYRFLTKPIPALQGIARNDCTLYIGTFSKTLFPALRIGFVAFPGPVTNEIGKANFLLGSTAPLFLQSALAEFIKHGHFAKHLRRMKRIYGNRRTMFTDLVQRKLGKWLEPLDAGSGLQTAWRLRGNFSDSEVCYKAIENDLRITPLSIHYLHGSPTQGLILGYATMDEGDAERAVGQLRCVFQQLD